jgi:predicted PhzF superfamily epimerase YddE/YHI9
MNVLGQIATEFVVEQGVEMRRPSRIDVTVVTPETVIVRGRAKKLSDVLEPWSGDEPC